MNIPAGLAVESLLERRMDRSRGDTDDTRDVGRVDAAQFERHDLLLALGDVDPCARGTLVAALGHFGEVVISEVIVK
jgi:hypothetical protein